MDGRLEGVREVVRVDSRMLTGKTMNEDCFNSEGRLSGSGSAWESLLLENLCEYMVHSQRKSEDEFLARHWDGSSITGGHKEGYVGSLAGVASLPIWRHVGWGRMSYTNGAVGL